jgi:hypothetical protein
MIMQDQIDVEDESLVVNLPSGHYYDFVLVSEIKRLLQEDMPLEFRARFLELLSNRARGLITMEAVAAVKPASDAAIAMLDALAHLSIEDKCKVMRRIEIFNAHIALNPSIINAIKLCRHHAPLETST